MAETPDKKVIRDTDAEAVRLAKTLISNARHGALAVNGLDNTHPLVSRIQLSTDCDGSPVTLVSSLSPHTKGMIDKPACAVLIGEAGKGDPLAHSRISVAVTAKKVAHDTDDHARLRRRHLARHPKAALYVDFGDFSFFRLQLQSASLNGGFGKAYNLTREDLAMSGDIDGMAAMEESAVNHMNADHAEAVALYAEVLAGEKPGKWQVATMDPEGMDLVLGDQSCRVFFDEPLADAADLRKVLKMLANTAHTKQENTA